MTGLPPAVQAAYERLLASPPLATADLSAALGAGVELFPDVMRRVARHTDAERVLMLFAADCAEMVLPIYEAEHPGDDRPRRAIEAVRGYVLGSVTAEELAAARSAARDAAEDAFLAASAWAAARSVPEAVLGDMSYAIAEAAADLTDNEAWEVLEDAWEACEQLLLRYHRAELTAGGTA